jgi:hypothetical protein
MRTSRLLLVPFLLLLTVATMAPTALAAPEPVPGLITAAPSAQPYAGFTPYGQIKGVLDGIVATSDRVRYEIMGTSAGGRDLYLVIVARPDVLAHLGDQLAFAQLKLDDPASAQALAAAGGAKAPVFINCSIHGNEPNGTDAGLRLIKRLAYADASDTEAQAILDNCIVLVNVCQNPDGRVNDVRTNANGFDLNRDFLTLSQPETRATATQIERWLPITFFDLHGYYNPMRIDPCTPPHNPNYEYDLFIKWGLPEAYAMRAAVTEHTNGNIAYPNEPGRHNVNIPYVDMKQGYEDYSPFYTPQFAMYYGSIGLTMETFAEDDLGTDGDFWACWAGIFYAAQHKNAMLVDQIEQFRRGVVGYQRAAITFPDAYVIPAAAPLQRSPLAAARVVDYLVAAGAEVDVASSWFTTNGKTYPAGTYVVSLRQPLRGLVNTWLWKGEDISYLTNSMYSVCATDLPELFGFDRAIIGQPFAALLVRVSTADLPPGGVAGGAGTQYLLANDSNNAVAAVNELLDDGATIKITTAQSAGVPAGTFVVSGVAPAALAAIGGEDHVTFTPTSAPPADTKTLHTVKLAVDAGTDVKFVLRNLGFHVTSIGATASLAGYDAVVNSSNALNSSNVKAYVKAGGGYVGLGYGGAGGPLGNLLPVSINVTNAYDNNALVRAGYRSGGLVGADNSAADWAFVDRPVWFTSVGAGVSVDASYRSDPDWYLCGYWRDRAGAAGKPAVVSGAVGSGKVVYIGFAPTYRAYPEGQFRLLANAIWYGMK